MHRSSRGNVNFWVRGEIWSNRSCKPGKLICIGFCGSTGDYQLGFLIVDKRAALGKNIYRRIRYLGLTERLWTWAKGDTRLRLSAGVEIDVKADDVFIDCGANVGDVTSLFARTGGVVYAFEPHPICFSILRRRFSMMPNVHLFNQGAMDRACNLVLRTPDAHDQYDSLDTTVGASFIP